MSETEQVHQDIIWHFKRALLTASVASLLLAVSLQVGAVPIWSGVSMFCASALYVAGMISTARRMRS